MPRKDRKINVGRNNGKMGRPRTEIDEKTWKEIENYLACGANKQIVLDLLKRRGFEISRCTLERRTVEKYKMTFEQLKMHNYDMMRMSVRGKLYQESQKGGKVGVDAAKHLDKYLNKTIEQKDLLMYDIRRQELELKRLELEFNQKRYEESSGGTGNIRIDDDLYELITGAAEVDAPELEAFAEVKELEEPPEVEEVEENERISGN